MSDSANKAVFMSYASQDAEAAKRICEALRQVGVEVWFDQSELRGGEAWDRSIRRQIRECALFVPVISARTQARPEGYFRLEWHLAEQRSLLIAKGRPFIVPVGIDATTENEALVPEAFLAVQWTRLPGGETPPVFVEQVQRLLTGSSGMEAGRPRPATRGEGTAPPQQDGPPSIPDFDLLRLIGQGSYGDVWLARDVTGIYRAIKVVWRDRFTDAQPYEREFRGLKEFAAISLGESIQMALLHVGRNDAAGFFYYVMELADDADRGRDIDPARYVPLTLSEVRARQGRARVPARDCLTYGVELARVLAGFHRRGLIHRDIKPSNVIFVGGVPKLADIGLVTTADATMTYVGTEGFVPPEGPGLASADVFALGRLLYELATGLDRQEFPQLPPDLKQLPDHRLLLELNEIILRACDPVAGQRYRDGAALLADLEALQAGNSVRRRRVGSGLLRATAASVVVVAVAVVAWWQWRPPAATPISQLKSPSQPPARDAKSIAVLPFSNLSDDKAASAFFSDGVQEDILTNLANIQDFRVIPRTSVEQYRGTKKKITQIAQELRVTYILEGSVRRAGEQVRVTGQLSNALTEESMWAKSYDRNLKDIFLIQAELATDIAQALKTALSPEEKTLVERRPTASAAAYEQFLKAREIRRGFGAVYENARAMEPFLREAVRLDPQYAAAYAELVYVYTFGSLTRERHAKLAMAQAAVDQARRLAPDSPEVILALGDYYLCSGDTGRALEQFERFRRLRPNDPDFLVRLAEAYQRQGPGMLQKTWEIRKRLEDVDPGNIANLYRMVNLLVSGRRYADAIAVQRRVWTRLPDNPQARHYIGFVTFLLNGSTELQDQFWSEIKPDAWAHGVVWRLRWLQMQGRLDEIVALDHATTLAGDNATVILFWGDYATINMAIVHAARGDVSAARARLGDLPGQLHRQTMPGGPSENRAESWFQLGIIEGVLGNQVEALRCAKRAIELSPKPLAPGEDLAIIYAWAGDKDSALAEIGRLLLSDLGANMGGNNVHALRRDPSFFPLQGDPRFEALLNDPRNNAPLF